MQRRAEPALPSGMTRRTALSLALVASAAALAGCTRRHHGAGQVKRRQVDPDVTLAAKVLDGESTVLAMVRATADAHPALAPALAPVARAHRAHIRLLAHALPPAPSRSPSPSGLPARTSGPATPSTGPPSPPVTVPPQRSQALRVLAAAENALAASDRQAAFAALSGHYARVLASMAASAAQQAVVIRTEMAGAGR